MNRAVASIFKDVNLEFDSKKANALASQIWGAYGVPEGAKFWGIKHLGQPLDPENFTREVVEKMAKQLAKFGESAVRKALTTSGAQVFIPTIIDPSVIDVLKRRTPFLAFVPKYATYSLVSRVNVRKAPTTPSFESGDKTDDFTTTASTYQAVDIEVKFLYNPGAVALPAIAGAQLITDIYAEEIQASFIDFMQLKEKAQLIARTSVGTETWGGLLPADANAWNGVFKALHEFDVAESTSQYNELPAGSQISLGHLEKILENVEVQGGNVDAFFCDLATFNRLRNQARLQQRYAEGSLAVGAPRNTFTFDGIPVIATPQLPTGSTQAVIGLDARAVRSDILVPESLVEVAQNMRPVKEFFWMGYEAFTLVAGQWASAYVVG